MSKQNDKDVYKPDQKKANSQKSAPPIRPNPLAPNLPRLRSPGRRAAVAA